MANKERGDVDLEINGRHYKLRLDLNALCELEGALSTDTKTVTFEQALRLVERRQVLAVRAMLWAALLLNHPAITLRQAGDLMQEMGGISGIEQKLQAAVAASMPTPEDREGKANPPKARRSGRGGPSSSGLDG